MDWMVLVWVVKTKSYLEPKPKSTFHFQNVGEKTKSVGRNLELEDRRG